jgi:hypothetical protein
VEVNECELDEENLPDIEDIVSVCAGLVSVDQERDIIHLVHYTTQEFFEELGEICFPTLKRTSQQFASPTSPLTFLDPAPVHQMMSSKPGSDRTRFMTTQRGIGDLMFLGHPQRWLNQHCTCLRVKRLYQLVVKHLWYLLTKCADDPDSGITVHCTMSQNGPIHGSRLLGKW